MPSGAPNAHGRAPLVGLGWAMLLPLVLAHMPELRDIREEERVENLWHRAIVHPCFTLLWSGPSEGTSIKSFGPWLWRFDRNRGIIGLSETALCRRMKKTGFVLSAGPCVGASRTAHPIHIEDTMLTRSDCKAPTDCAATIRLGLLHFGLPTATAFTVHRAAAIMPEESPLGIRLNGVTFAYPGCPPFIKDASLDLPRGSRCLLIGANGTGKTTLLQMVAGEWSRVTTQ